MYHRPTSESWIGPWAWKNAFFPLANNDWCVCIPEFRRFLQYARGSAQETLTQLRVAAALDLSQARAIHEIEGRVALVIKTLGRLIAHPPPDR